MLALAEEVRRLALARASTVPAPLSLSLFEQDAPLSVLRGDSRTWPMPPFTPLLRQALRLARVKLQGRASSILEEPEAEARAEDGGPEAAAEPADGPGRVHLQQGGSPPPRQQAVGGHRRTGTSKLLSAGRPVDGHAKLGVGSRR